MLFIPLITLVWLPYTQGDTFQPVSSTCIYWDSLTRYKNGEEQKLHCILDENGIEGLVNTTWILIDPDICPIFNRHSEKVDRVPCNQDLGRCPDINIRSYQAFQYNACYGKQSSRMQSGGIGMEHQPSQFITNNDCDKTFIILLVLVLVSIILFLAIALACLILRERRKKSRNKLKAGIKQDKEDEEKTLVSYKSSDQQVKFKPASYSAGTEEEKYNEKEALMSCAKFTQEVNPTANDSEATTKENETTEAVAEKSTVNKEQHGEYIHVKDSEATTKENEANEAVAVMSMANKERYGEYIQNSDIDSLILRYSYNTVQEFFRGSEKQSYKAFTADDIYQLARHMSEKTMQKCDRDSCSLLRNTTENTDTSVLDQNKINDGDVVISVFRFVAEEVSSAQAFMENNGCTDMIELSMKEGKTSFHF